ncbi:bifunctional diaminohydroxyphosphoribosylaminopyrimidine deaminase/5-amino-6-(5-phosphoribosylamino)uracil reductase RibD [Phenylobacterium sp.]|uniref:bifunctional diaminohydroxyphosphoribosylaminopyrimidine deaminase/5-amino-6-(5-phosphoribosylamino)uracil reductase RibD n=1 Tax=Phenylobacterium sp. TaxID=1871053 RepID=UPI0025CCD701|nr:bifunctional diaminohydroxyphosphoribosylaminopyrimidine deaminase/5-amino-6-(5-phosphoribosylamino)uracil reductase RibD [Phenylobacterium sp.]
MTDEDFMHRAIALAATHVGLTGDNPSVGCVIVRDGAVLGEGVTGLGGRPHGEELALAAVAGSVAGATAYVTLEPCAERSAGTASCSERLAAAGLARVVIACDDASVFANGRGRQRLQAAGIVTDRGLLAVDAAPLYAAYSPARLSESRR